MSGIKPKVVTKGKQHDEHAKRYIWYPLSNLDFAQTQSTSPIWSPKIPKGRIVLLESFEYMTQIENENEFSGGGVILGERTMGTDAQVAFIMGSTDGVGYLARGMTYLESLTDIEPSIAEDIEKMLLPTERGEVIVPRDLIDFQKHLESLVITGENPISQKANETLMEMKNGLGRAINYCMTTSGELEKELAEGRAGRLGIKYLSATHRYYFEQIRRPLPDDKIGVNMGDQILRALQPLVGNAQNPPSTFQNDVEANMLRLKLQEAERENDLLRKTNEQQSEVIAAYEDTSTESGS